MENIQTQMRMRYMKNTLKYMYLCLVMGTNTDVHEYDSTRMQVHEIMHIYIYIYVSSIEKIIQACKISELWQDTV